MDMTTKLSKRVPHLRGSPIRYANILYTLRRQILAGELAVEERLPTREELAIHFRTTKITVQRAIDVLAAEGLVRSEGSRGTFVAVQRPTRAHYALTFPWGRTDRSSQFYEALHLEAAKMQSPERQVSVFHDIEGPSDTDDFRRLMELVMAHQLAGVIFAARPHRLWGYPVLTEPGVPRVVIANSPNEPGIPTVYPDVTAFLPQAFDRLAELGRTRVAVLIPAWGAAEIEIRRIQALAKPRGMRIEPHWVQAVGNSEPSWARQTVRLLFQGAGTSWPDALVITNDNLVPDATAGLLSAGVRVASCGERSRTRDVLVLAHANFPYPTPAAAPVMRLGSDISPLLALCVDRLDQQRRGETPPAHTALPLRFENEYQIGEDQ